MHTSAQSNFGFAHELIDSMGRQFYTLMRGIESYFLQTAQHIPKTKLRQARPILS